jgi:GNAT superfamily N-acetyltransferase
VTQSEYSAPAPIAANHDLAEFDCGDDALNGWLRRRALANQVGLASRTFVICTTGGIVAAYYSLATGAIARQLAPGPVRRNMPEQIPVVVLGRLAVDLRHQRTGLGSAMVRDAMLRVLSVSREVAVKALLVHAISAEAAAFYKRYDFVESPMDPMILLLPVATIAQALADVD